jgi:hypothetical protein
MGNRLSTLYDTKAFFERKLIDSKRQLVRVLSKSNSMESLDKTEIQDLKIQISVASTMLYTIDKAIEDEYVPSF